MWHLLLTAVACVSVLAANLAASVVGHATMLSTLALLAGVVAALILAVLPIRCRERTPHHCGEYHDR